MKISIIDCDHGFTYPEEEIISKAGHDLKVYQTFSSEKIKEIVKGSDAIICQYAKINREIIEKMDRCKIIGRYGVGVDNIDLQFADENGIKVVYDPYYCINEVADHALSLIFCFYRNIIPINGKIRKLSDIKQIDYTEMLKFMKNVENSIKLNIGIIGFGNIGKNVAKKLMNFGFNIFVYDPYIPREIIEEIGCKKTDLEFILKNSDFITIHTPLTDETRKMISTKELNLMKKTSYIINTARGGIIDEKALLSALKEKRIAGAGLDVLENEPIDRNHPFISMENVILTPHIAFFSQTSIINLKKHIASYVVNALNGKGELVLANDLLQK